MCSATTEFHRYWILASLPRTYSPSIPLFRFSESIADLEIRPREEKHVNATGIAAIVELLSAMRSTCLDVADVVPQHR